MSFRFLSKKFIYSFLLLFLPVWGMAQEKSKKEFYPACVAFYNVENLYDTINNPLTNDEEFLPDGANRWNGPRYWKKINDLSTVISQIGTEFTPDGPAILGLSEIENREVLEDLVNNPKLKEKNYKIVHYDSPDRRGVDVALIYQSAYFTVTSSKNIPLRIPGRDDFYTRDQLLVSGLLDGELIHVIVAHWPSRRGGEKRSRPMRIAAAELGRKIIDSLQQIDPEAKVIYMGDLNDDPVNESVKTHLKASAKLTDTTGAALYNPMYDLFRKGIGSLAWRDSWNLFDQLLISTSLLKKDYSSFRYYGARVFNKTFLTQSEGNYKGYPFRTFAGGSYQGGYSDHFPVYLLLVKEKKE